MDISKYKEFLKSYSVLIVPVVIALAGTGFLVPAQLISGRLQKTIQSESLKKGTEIKSLIATAVPARQWEIERHFQELHKNDANQIALLARGTTTRQLLSYDLFPEPKSDSVFIFDDFGPRLRSEVERLAERLKAGECPTPAQLQQATGSARPGRYFGLGYGSAAETIRDELCRRKAESIKVYVTLAKLPGYEFWGRFKYADAKNRDEALKTCWYGQLAFWIFEDIFATIESMNAGAENVFGSPVKRLVEVGFTPGTGAGFIRVPAGPALRQHKFEGPRYVTKPEDGLTAALTRRTCDQAVDVVHFRFSVIIRSQDVLRFIKQLCSAKEHTFTGWHGDEPPRVLQHNQITVLQCETVAVARDSAEHELYRYGDDAVVQLNLVCEYIFDKQAYDQVKPKPVKDEIAGTGQSGTSGRAPATRPARTWGTRPGGRPRSQRRFTE